MRTLAVILLVMFVGAIVLLGRQHRAPEPTTAIADKIERTAPRGDEQVVGYQSKAVRPPEAEKPGLIDQLCLPGTYMTTPDGGEVGMKNIAKTVDEFEAGLVGLKQKLVISDDPEHLLTAAFLSESADERLALIQRALGTSPNDANLLRWAITFCRLSQQQCPLQNWETQLLDADSHNSESWILVATNRYDRGDHTGALDALRQAASAGETRTYFPETMELILRSLGAGSHGSQGAQLLDAMGILGSAPIDDRKLSMCARASGNSDWIDACLRYGSLAERQGRILMSQAMGLAIQRQALQVMGDTDGQAAIASKVAIVRAQGLEHDGRDVAKMLVLQAEPNVQRTYLTTFVQTGEAAANAFLSDELDRRLQTSDRVDCTGF